MTMLILLLIEIFFIYKTIMISRKVKINGGDRNTAFGVEWWTALSVMFGGAIIVGFVERYLSNISIFVALLATILGCIAAAVSIRESFKNSSHRNFQ